MALNFSKRIHSTIREIAIWKKKLFSACVTINTIQNSTTIDVILIYICSVLFQSSSTGVLLSTDRLLVVFIANIKDMF